MSAHSRLAVVGAASLLVLCASSAAQTYTAPRGVIGSGGGISSGGAFTLSGTVGQCEPGPVAQGGAFTLNGGFWAGVRDDRIFANGFE